MSIIFESELSLMLSVSQLLILKSAGVVPGSSINSVAGNGGTRNQLLLIIFLVVKRKNLSMKQD